MYIYILYCFRQTFDISKKKMLDFEIMKISTKKKKIFYPPFSSCFIVWFLYIELLVEYLLLISSINLCSVLPTPHFILSKLVLRGVVGNEYNSLPIYHPSVGGRLCLAYLLVLLYFVNYKIS